MTKDYGYELSLKVKDQGERSFTASGDADYQGDLADQVAWAVALAVGVMHMPPDAFKVAGFIEAAAKRYDSFEANLASLWKFWDANSDIENAVRVTVDLDVLMPDSDEKERAEARVRFKRAGFKVKERPQRGESPDIAPEE